MSTESEHKEAFSADAKKHAKAQRQSEHDIEAMVAEAAASGNIDMHANADQGEHAKWEIDLPKQQLPEQQEEQGKGKSKKLKDRVKNLVK